MATYLLQRRFFGRSIQRELGIGKGFMRAPFSWGEKRSVATSKFLFSGEALARAEGFGLSRRQALLSPSASEKRCSRQISTSMQNQDTGDRLNLSSEIGDKKATLENSLEQRKARLREHHGFELVEPLRSGYFSEVWLANAPEKLKRKYGGKEKVVVKFEKRQKGTNLSQEYLLLSGEKHPHLIELLDFFPNCNALIMEYCSGGSLHDFLVSQKEPLSMELRVTFAEQLFTALADLHETQTFHRNVHPTNLLLDDENKLKLSDFGLAVVDCTPLHKDYEHLMYVGKEIFASNEERDPKVLDIRFFGLVLLKMLHFGEKVKDYGENLKEIEKEFPDWCPQQYRQLVLFCTRSPLSHKQSIINEVKPLLLSLKNSIFPQTEKKEKSVHQNLKQATPEQIQEWIQDLHAADIDERKDAAESLGSRDLKSFPQAIEALVKKLQDHNLYVRRHAAWILGSQDLTPFPHAIETLIKALQDPIHLVRRDAAWSLGKQDLRSFPQAIEALIQALQHPKHDVRSYAAWSLGKQHLKDFPRAIEALISALEDPNHDVRSYAAEGLGRQDLKSFPQAIEALIKTLRDPNQDVRSNAAWCLSSQELRAFPQSIETLTQALRDSNKEAAEILGSQDLQSSPRAIEALTKALQDHHFEVRSNAAKSLGRQYLKSFPHAIESLIKTLQDHDFEVRRDAAKGLGEQDLKSFPRAIEALINALEDPHFIIRSHAAESLGKQDLKEFPHAIEALINALQDRNDDQGLILNAAAQSLGKQSPSLLISHLPFLHKILEQTKDDALKRVVFLLGQFQNQILA